MTLNTFTITPNTLIISLLILLSIRMTAQNHLYTTEQFGIDGAMLGGAVVAGTDDVSMTFYNPASIHKVPAQFSVSIIQPRLRSFGFKDFWGSNGSSSANLDFSQKPDLISFKFQLGKLDLAFLKISKSEFSDVFRTEQEFIRANQKTTQFFDYEYHGEDDWYGFGTNFKLGTNWYVGLSQFVSNADFSYRNSIFLEALATDQDHSLIRLFDFDFDGSYSNIGLVTKIGFLLDTDRHDLGFTITSPTYLRVITGGDFFNTRTSAQHGETTIDQVIDNEIDPTIKTPWTFDLGYSWALNANQKLWLNTSYHTGIAEHNMAVASTLGTDTYWRNGSKPVFNFSFGYSHIMHANLHLSAAIRTNYLAYENVPTPSGSVRNTIFDGNHIHYVIGSKLKHNRSTILLGLDYGTIRNIPDQENFQRFSNIDVLSPNLGDLQKNNLSILLTYGFILDSFRKSKN